jgi:tetratricopeptide (TPR) repeat protein
MAHNNLGLILQSQGKFKEATSHFEAALALKSDAAEALTNLGVLSAAAGDPARALDYHIRAVKADPRSAMAQNNLGMALAQAGKVGEGIEHLRISIQIKPRYAGAHANLANASAIQGDMRTAASEYRIALALSPGHVESANNLAWILATAKEPNLRGPAEAVQLAEYAVKASKSKSPGLLDTLAAAYASAGRYEEAVKTGREAVQMAEAAGTRDMAQRMSERLRLYSSGKPYVSAPAPKASP